MRIPFFLEKLLEYYGHLMNKDFIFFVGLFMVEFEKVPEQIDPKLGNTLTDIFYDIMVSWDYGEESTRKARRILKAFAQLPVD